VVIGLLKAVALSEILPLADIGSADQVAHSAMNTPLS
jgi:hypothetical protein